MHWTDGHGGLFMGGMWVFWILLLVVVVLVVRWATMSFRQGGGSIAGSDQTRAADTPEDVLKKRYARGEISREDLENKLQDVRG